jgi:hypothetical protein
MMGRPGKDSTTLAVLQIPNTRHLVGSRSAQYAWPKGPLAIAKIASARRAGVDIQANVYAYVAGGTEEGRGDAARVQLVHVLSIFAIGTGGTTRIAYRSDR